MLKRLVNTIAALTAAATTATLHLENQMLKLLCYDALGCALSERGARP